MAPSQSRQHIRSPPRTKPGGVAGQASWISCVINLVNTIVGAGVLAMPLAMSHLGMVPGTVVILWAGLTAGFGLYLQSRCANYLERGFASFFALSQITYPNAAVVFDAAIAIKCFGVGISYLIIIGDLMPGVVLGFADAKTILPFLIDRHFWITAFMLVVIPLSFLRRLDSLKYTSVIALISIGYLIILIVYHFAAKDTIDHYTSPLRIFAWAGPVPALSSFPVIVFAYTCHQNMFSILNEISDDSHSSTLSVVIASIGSAAATYILVAITGYLSFGNEVGDNIVAQYAPSVSATIGRAAIVVLVMFSYPLQVHPCRASVDAVLKWRPKGGFFANRNSSTPTPLSATPPSPSRDVPLLHSPKQKPKAEMGETRFAAITTAIIILSYIVAMTVSSLGAVLAYVGSTGSTSISFILPGLFYYKISSPDSPLHQKLIKAEDDYDYETTGHADSDDNNDGNGDSDGDETIARVSEGSLSPSLTRGDHRNRQHRERQGLLSGSGVFGTISSTSSRWLRGRRHRFWRRKLLRRLSLALAIYGVVVMVVCLVVNTYFVAAH